MIDNKTFLANEAYHRHVANQGAVSGTEATVKSRLESAIEQIAYNLKHGGNNKVYDYDVSNVSKKVERIIMSYTDYVNKNVWQKKS